MRKIILKLIQRWFLKVDPRFRSGDLIIYGDNEFSVYELVGIYYSYELKPFAFIRDDSGKIAGVPLNLCRSPYVSRKK